jgi:hypothetical protein
MWFYPPSVFEPQLVEQYFEYSFEGEIAAFKQLNGEGIVVHRQIKK